MTSKNSFLIFILGATLFAPGCGFFHALSSNKANKNAIAGEQSKNYREPKRIAEIEDEAIKESSGIVASRRNPNVFWTHNDSGDDAFLYAFDRAGKKLGTWRVANAKNVDWEDIAIFEDAGGGESFLFIGDIGNNERDRAELVIYKVREPQINRTDADSSKKNPRSTESAQAIRIKYPDERRNAETLLVHPKTGDLYIVSKDSVGDANVYKLAAPFSTGKPATLAKIGSIAMPSLTPGILTGGDIAPDGKKLILCDYFAAYEFELSSNAKTFDEIWKQTPQSVDLGERQQGEAVAYAATGRAILATSEKRPTPLIEVERK
jgi:hypothetical protein